MRTYDLTPFSRSTVGFDRFFSLLDQATRTAAPAIPHNIGVPARTITASALRLRFSQGELSIVSKENTLTIKGEKSPTRTQRQVRGTLSRYRGARLRASFQLADFVVVKNASLENGLLHVDLVRRFPRPRSPATSRFPRPHRLAGDRQLGRESRRLTKVRISADYLLTKTPRETGAFFCDS